MRARWTQQCNKAHGRTETGQMEVSTGWKRDKGDGTGVRGSRKRVIQVGKRPWWGVREWEGESPGKGEFIMKGDFVNDDVTKRPK